MSVGCPGFILSYWKYSFSVKKPFTIGGNREENIISAARHLQIAVEQNHTADFHVHDILVLF